MVVVGGGGEEGISRKREMRERDKVIEIGREREREKERDRERETAKERERDEVANLARVCIQTHSQVVNSL